MLYQDLTNGAEVWRALFVEIRHSIMEIK